jgi:predicted Zn-ribbon and HTH transcriptional regulator
MIKVACFDCGFVWDWSPNEPVVCPECGSDDVLDLETDDLTKTIDD